MGCKAWRNLGAIFLACAGLVGCNNGPERAGGPFAGAARQQPNAWSPNSGTTTTTTVGQGTQGQVRFPSSPGVNPAGSAAGPFNPMPSGPSALPPGNPNFPTSGSSVPGGQPFQRMSNDISVPSSPGGPTSPINGSQFGTSSGSFPGGPPAAPTAPAGFPAATRGPMMN